MTTKHTAACRMTFGRPQPATGCARCAELASGAPARTWRGRSRGTGYPTAAAIKTHDCKAAGCMSVCTFGDW